jgi:apolipoprotein N-acyltransferase
MMIRVVDFLKAVSGWRRGCVAIFLGVAAALSLPPYDAWPLLFVAVPAILVMLENVTRKNMRSSFLLGWCFGFGYFLFAFHWIGFAFLVNSEDYLWMMPFAVGGLSAAMAIYWGLAFLCVALSGFKRLPLVLAFASAIGVAEFLRGILFTGFPWAAPGLAVDGMGALSQTASIWGMGGLTLLILMWAGTWPHVFDRRFGASSRCVAVIIILALPLSWAWGAWRLHEGVVANVEGVNIRIVQPNISQDDKWRGDNARAIFDQLLEMSARPSLDGKTVTHIIWPESAVPFLINESNGAKIEVAQLLGEGRTLVTGTLRREKSVSGNPDEDRVYNSVLAFDGFGNVIAQYDKWRLVPGGEFLPFEWLLKPLGFRKVVTLPGSFAAGHGPETFSLAGAPSVGFSICYEAIFPDRFVDANKRPGWLINVTNDGWFGQSTGPYQHLAQLRLRAIEQGLPVVRAANTGISAVIDPYGRYVRALELGKEGTTDSPLPQNLAPTTFAKVGQIFEFLLVILFLAVGLLIALQSKVAKRIQTD